MIDFIPQGLSEFAEWMENFTTHFTVLATKYNLSGEVAQLDKDNRWVQYWVQAKFSAKRQEKQISDFIDAVVNGKIGDPQPDNPQWTLPTNQPGAIPAGLTRKMRSLARQIKANPQYTKADGALLGIIGAEDAELSPETSAPAIELRPLANYAVEVKFRKYNADAMRIEIRHKGGAWISTAFLTSSPGVFNAVPSSMGDVELIEVRAVYLVKNQAFGNYSPTYSVTIQP